jgi:hypothetical protein
MEAFIVSVLMFAAPGILVALIMGILTWVFCKASGNTKSFKNALKVSGVCFLIAFVAAAVSPAARPKMEAKKKPNPEAQWKGKEHSVIVPSQSKEAEDKARQEKFDSLTNAWREKYNQPN